jgi:PAS domain S-box-containing protein
MVNSKVETMFKKLSIANKMFLAFVALTVAVTGIVGAMTFWQARSSLATLAFDQLTSVREMKANQVEDYLQLIANQVATFSEDRMVIEAMRQLENAYHGLTDELDYGDERIAEIDAELAVFYETEFLPRLRRNLEVEPTAADYLPTSLAARVLQHLYISGNPHNVGSKDFLVDAGDGSEYSRVHAKVHPIFRNYLQKFGYYDIFLIDANHGEIIYTVFKEVDVGTSLLDGPYAESGLGRVFRATRDSTSPERVEIVDFEPYLPSYNRPAAFVASPVFDHGKRVGVLVFQMPIDRINGIMTNDQNWSAVGLGASGETYIVADDYRLRNQSRFLIEDSENYFRMLENTGTPHEIVEQIRNLDSTIGLQEVKTVGAEAALAGETDTRLFDDYRGVSVLSSYRPLAVEGLHWVIMSEIDAAEAFGPIGELARRLSITIALLLIAVFVAAVVFSRTLTRPLAQLRRNSAALADGDLDARIDTRGRDEIGDLARDFERMRQALKKVVGELEQLNVGLERKVEERTADLESSERRVKSILNNAADGIIVIDGKGTVQAFNPSAETLFARPADEVVGRNIKMLMPERLAKDHDKHLERYHATGKKHIIGETREVVGQRKDGSEFPIDLRVGETVLGDEKIFVGIVRDITERKQFEKKIADNLSFVTTLVDSVPNPIFVKDTAGRYVNFNRAYEEAFDIQREDIIGKSLMDLDFFPEDYRKTRHEEDVRLLRDGGSAHCEMSVVLGDGQAHDMLFWARAFDLSDGSRGGVLGVFVDISRQKELERQLAIANKRMGDELNIGRQIQMSMIPLTFPRFPEHKGPGRLGLYSPGARGRRRLLRLLHDRRSVFRVRDCRRVWQRSSRGPDDGGGEDAPQVAVAEHKVHGQHHIGYKQ